MDLLIFPTGFTLVWLRAENLSQTRCERTHAHSGQAGWRKGVKSLAVVQVRSAKSTLFGDSLFSSRLALWEEKGAAFNKSSVEERKTPSEKGSTPASSFRCHMDCVRSSLFSKETAGLIAPFFLQSAVLPTRALQIVASSGGARINIQHQHKRDLHISA